MTLKKLDIARRQLLVAINLFVTDGDLVSVITLAGAAEEIFGKTVSRLDRENAIGTMVRFHDVKDEEKRKLINQANFVKNALKHNDKDDDFIEFNEKQEAIAMLSRALTNYLRIDIREASQLMETVYTYIQNTGGFYFDSHETDTKIN